MKSKEEFMAEFDDEIRGLLLASFADAATNPVKEMLGDQAHAKNGRSVTKQMQRARDMLNRMYLFIHDITLPKPPETTPATTKPAAPANGTNGTNGTHGKVMAGK